ncbi:MAG: hypothetical protein C9356_14865 [Oleiphilus sp.]|nr:MAG: hypothetical protein C9356_14865 [Oleiphilus sp.]
MDVDAQSSLNSRERSLLNDPSVSYWLKEQLEVLQKRDPLDALRDAETLVEVLREKTTSKLQGSRSIIDVES